MKSSRFIRDGESIEEQASPQTPEAESLSILAKGLAHEVNNPLSVIRFSNKLLKNKTITKEKKDKLHARIDEYVLKCFKITQDMSQFTREITDLDFLTSVVVADWLDDMTRVFVHKARALLLTCEVINDCPKNHEISLKKTVLEHVAVNLLGKAMIAAKNRSANTETGTFGIHCFIKEAHFHMEVFDNGDGICPDVLQNMFEPSFCFWSSARENELSLHLTRSLLKNCQGHIVLDTTK